MQMLLTDCSDLDAVQAEGVIPDEQADRLATHAANR